MSDINTNGIDVNYPIPGQNNSSQGFRDNFASIKTNLDSAGNEISDLQTKVVVKSALNNTTVDNNMGNTLISNAATRSFRATTYNLGNALSGTVLVDVSLGDVQYGTIAGNVTFQFGGWAPYGTQSNVQLQLAVSNSSAVVNFPSQVSTANGDYGITTLENYVSTSNVSIPYNVNQLDYRLSTTDCGNTIVIEPYNRPRQATQLQVRSPSPTGFQGDVPGTTSVDSSMDQLVISATTVTSNLITTTGNTTQLYTDLPIVFTGNTTGTGLTAGTTYYVRNVYSSTQFTVSSSLGGANVSLSTATPTTYANPVRYAYFCTDTYNSTTYSKTVSATNSSGNVTLNNTTSLVTNAPIIFSGTTVGGITANAVYYIKTIGTGGNITISRSRTNGVADSTVTLTTASGSFSATAYIGSDIWKRVALNSW